MENKITPAKANQLFGAMFPLVLQKQQNEVMQRMNFLNEISGAKTFTANYLPDESIFDLSKKLYGSDENALGYDDQYQQAIIEKGATGIPSDILMYQDSQYPIKYARDFIKPDTYIKPSKDPNVLEEIKVSEGTLDTRYNPTLVVDKDSQIPVAVVSDPSDISQVPGIGLGAGGPAPQVKPEAEAAPISTPKDRKPYLFALGGFGIALIIAIILFLILRNQ